MWCCARCVRARPIPVPAPLTRSPAHPRFFSCPQPDTVILLHDAQRSLESILIARIFQAAAVDLESLGIIHGASAAGGRLAGFRLKPRSGE